MLKKIITISVHYALAITLIFFSYYFYPFYYHCAIGLYLYLGVIFILYRIIPKHHNRGIENIKRNNLDKALFDFDKSYQYFNKNSFIDKYRFIFLLNLSKVSFKESALINQAYVMCLKEEYNEAEKFYKMVIKLNHDNQIALNGINLIKKIK